jgi:hypothetical protein
LVGILEAICRLESRSKPVRFRFIIETCEYCNEEGAEIPFDNILERVTGSDPTVTDYILEAPAKCPNCCRETFLKKTLIDGVRDSQAITWLTSPAYCARRAASR